MSALLSITISAVALIAICTPIVNKFAEWKKEMDEEDEQK